MRENPYDRRMAKIVDRGERVSEKIAKDFKNMKPFDKTPVSDAQMLDAYRTLTLEDMQYLVQTHGKDALNNFIMQMEAKKIERGEL